MPNYVGVVILGYGIFYHTYFSNDFHEEREDVIRSGCVSILG